MALTSKQRAQLRGLAMTEDTIIQIGKGGITENTVTQVKDALAARELIKGRVLESSLLTAREAADALAEACAAETVQTIGSKFVLYKRNAKEPKIALVKEKKK
ncbi:MAG: YhbY family RNA-binding protein [Oscillospiraceae bacterium]